MTDVLTIKKIVNMVTFVILERRVKVAGAKRGRNWNKRSE